MSSIGVPAGASSAVMVQVLAETAAALAALPAPEAAEAAMVETDQLLGVADLVGLAIDQRVGVVDAVGAAKTAGHASTTAWLRTGTDGDAPTGGRMAARDASRHRSNGRQFRRLPTTVAAACDGTISYGMASAIAAAVAVLRDDQDAAAAEQILLTLASDPTATVEKVRRAGRYLRQVLDPDGHLRDHEKTHRHRYLSAHLDDDGGMGGSFYLPPEPAARLQALFDTYARPSSQTDTRTQSQRQADVLIQLLAQAVAAELLIIVNAETLPDDSACADPAEADAEHPGANEDGTYVDKRASVDGGTSADLHARWGTNVVGDPDDTPDCSPFESPRHPENTANPTPPSEPVTSHRRIDPELVEQLNRIRDTRTRIADTTPSLNRCPAHGHGTNRDIPGLLLPTGHPLPARDVRRLARTSSLYRMVIQAPSKVLDLGSAVRAVPGWMRRAVLATYDTCAYDTCPIPAKWCEMDHVYPWVSYQRTRLKDLAPGCDHHNRDRAANPHRYQIGRTHDGRWHLTNTHRYRI